jgi:predicted metal-dependent peptidase
LPNIAQWLNYQKKLTVVFTPMGSGVQGYIRWDDFNSKTQSKTSNEGNIVYLNPNNILNPSISNNILFSFFAHELMHLITYQEKTVNYNSEEDT